MKIHHPSDIIAKEITDQIRDAAGEAEALKDLHPTQLKLIYQEGWLSMFVPQLYGGLGWSLPRVLEVEESLSWADASTAWVVTLSSGAGWFTGFLPPPLVAKITANEKMCFAGSGAATGTANQTEEGYEINGHWKYASGSLHATVFTANCVLHSGGLPQFNADGTPVVRAFLFFRNEVILQRHWDSMGMVATGSHSFEVKNLRVPAERCFSLDVADAVVKDPVFRYPFLQLAETTLSVNLSGMAMRFLDLCEILFARKTKSPGFQGPELNRYLANARDEMHKQRSAFYAIVRRSWTLCEEGAGIPSDILHAVSDESYSLAHRSRQIVDSIYPYCGLTAASTGHEMNRIWRNLHTASQHTLFNTR